MTDEVLLDDFPLPHDNNNAIAHRQVNNLFIFKAN
jgi:hypothetical protein